MRASATRPTRDLVRCTLCCTEREWEAFGWWNDTPYCHGMYDESPTCYEMANWPAHAVDMNLRGAQSNGVHYDPDGVALYRDLRPVTNDTPSRQEH